MGGCSAEGRQLRPCLPAMLTNQNSHRGNRPSYPWVLWCERNLGPHRYDQLLNFPKTEGRKEIRLKVQNFKERMSPA
jgi:hypothetical protein